MSSSAENSATARTSTVEQHGIATIPELERTGRPSDIFSILVGGDLALSLIVIGWLPVTFGLGWWSSVSSLLIGALLGSLVLAPTGLFGPRTGTNNSVSSGAHFGVVGRLIGSILALASALGFTALAVWTGGDALVAAGHRLLGLPDGDVALGLGYALISVIIIGIAIHGYHYLVLAEKMMVPTMGVVLALGVVAFAPDFDPGYSGGSYILDSFWPTWALSVIIASSTIVGYGPFVGDWTRYISQKRHSDRSLAWTVFAGAFIGLGIAYVFGAFTAVSFNDPMLPYAQSLVADAPLWYVFPIMLLGFGAGAAQGATGLYGTGLDTSSLIPRLSRVQATGTIGVVAVALVYLGVFVWDVVESISAFVTLLGIVTVPWVFIIIVGLWWRRGYYHAADLQLFIEGRSGGRYWFWRGLNLRAVFAWAPAAVVGLLFSNTPLGQGPWSSLANGIDISTLAAGIVGLVIYIGLLIAFPEPDDVFGPRGRRFQRDARSKPIRPNRAPGEALK